MDYDLAKGNQPTSPFIARNNRKRALQDFIQTQGKPQGQPIRIRPSPIPGGYISLGERINRRDQGRPAIPKPKWADCRGGAQSQSAALPHVGPEHGTERDRNELQAQTPITKTRQPQGPSSQRQPQTNHPTGGAMQPAAAVTRRPQAAALHVVGKGIFEVKPAKKRLEVCKRRPLYRVFAVFAKLSQNLPTLPSRSMPGLGFRRLGLPRAPADRLRGVSRERGGCCGPYWR